MRICLLCILLLSRLSVCHSFAQQISQDTLPENHLLVTLEILDDKLVGANEYLNGFTVSMDLPPEYLKDGLDIESLMALVRNQEITGTLTYFNGVCSAL